MDRIGVVGTSYRMTQAENLASASLPADFSDENFVELSRLAGFSELVYLGTCNRVEFHFRTETRIHRDPLLFHLRRSLADLTDGRCQLPDDDQLYIHHGMAAARHLFRVTAALDSMMVGEAQIAGQSKAAHEKAHDLGLLGGILDQTFHEAFHLAKRIRSETELTKRPVSLVTLVERTLQDHLENSSAPVLILGAGEMAQQTLRLLRNSDRDREVVIANRSLERAEEIAKNDHNVRAITLDEALCDPPTVALIVAATSSDTIVLNHDVITKVRKRLPKKHKLLLVDLAMPANIDQNAHTIAGVSLHGIEEMREEAEQNRKRRLEEMDECEKLVEHQILILRRRLQDRALSPAAKQLKKSFQEVADRAVNHSFSKDLAHLSEKEKKAVEKMAQQMVKRLVQVPLRGLKGAAWNHSSAVIDKFLQGMEEGSGAPDLDPEKG